MCKSISRRRLLLILLLQRRINDRDCYKEHEMMEKVQAKDFVCVKFSRKEKSEVIQREYLF